MHRPGLVCVDDQVLMYRAGGLLLYFPPSRVVRELAVRAACNIRNHPALLGDGVQTEPPSLDGNVHPTAVPIPPQVLDEQGLEIERVQVAACSGSVERHLSLPTGRLVRVSR